MLAALVVAVYGIENLLDRYGLMVTPGVLFDGLKYTDDHARMTAKLVVAVIALKCSWNDDGLIPTCRARSGIAIGAPMSPRMRPIARAMALA